MQREHLKKQRAIWKWKAEPYSSFGATAIPHHAASHFLSSDLFSNRKKQSKKQQMKEERSGKVSSLTPTLPQAVRMLHLTPLYFVMHFSTQYCSRFCSQQSYRRHSSLKCKCVYKCYQKKTFYLFRPSKIVPLKVKFKLQAWNNMCPVKFSKVLTIALMLF